METEMDVKSKSVTLPYDSEWRALQWAKENCPSYITNTPADHKLRPATGGWVRTAFAIEYFFSDERDATVFRLRWL